MAYADPLTESRPWPSPWGDELQDRVDRDQNANLAPEISRTITQDGDHYTWSASAFNAWAQATAITRGNDIPGQSSYTERRSYFNDTDHFVLGQPLQTFNAAGTPNDTSDDIEVGKRIYDPTSGRLTQRDHFGHLVMTYTWHDGTDGEPNGALASFTDANNHATALDDYKRGIPQTITYADASSKTLVVDDFGQIASVTNEVGATTTYHYNGIGRLTQIDWPTDGSHSWDARTIAWDYVSTGNGIFGTHLVRTVTEGAGQTITDFDGLLRPIRSEVKDIGTGGTADVTTRTSYDDFGRTTFASYPLAGSPRQFTIDEGIHTYHDALGRVMFTDQDSEIGTLITSTKYLAGNIVQVTDPKYRRTTTTNRALDTPSLKQPVKVHFADDNPTTPDDDATETTIVRDAYGKPLSMTETGTWADDDSGTISVTHTFVYDARQRLCKTVSPETGATGYGYDDAGNLTWTAQALTDDNTRCTAESAVPAGSKVSRTYDARNRLTDIDYPGTATADSHFTYYADGTPETAIRDATATGPASTWTQVWLKRGLLDHETLAINGSSYTVDYRYNTAGQLDSEEWPSGLALDFAPDGLGRPTQLGTYAHDIGYASNGTVATLTYGNGATMERSPNARMLPGGVHYAIDGLDLTNRSLTWDADGDLQMISDLVDASSPPADRIFADGFEVATPSVGTDGRSFYYDSLDRLIMMVSPRHGTETFGYDPLGNLHSRTLTQSWQSSQSTSYHYDTATNRIEDIDGVTVGYDTRGNVTSMQGHALTWNRANELIGDFQGTSYAYDARGWRIKQVTTVATDGGHDRTFIYDHNHRLVERIDNGVVTDFVSLGAVPVARITGGAATYILPDYQNTPLFELDSAGNITRSPDFLSYGRPVDAEGQGEIPSYTGAAGDPATGFLYLGARYMRFSRFLSVDPAPLDPTSPSGLNRYAYANDNPARYTDPYGRQSVEDIHKLDGCPSCVLVKMDTGWEAVPRGVASDVILAHASGASLAKYQNGPSAKEAAHVADIISVSATAVAIATAVDVPPVAVVAGAVDEAAAVTGFLLEPTMERFINIETLGGLSLLKATAKGSIKATESVRKLQQATQATTVIGAAVPESEKESKDLMWTPPTVRHSEHKRWPPSAYRRYSR